MTGTRVDSLLGLVVAGALLLILFAVLRRSPKIALVAWLVAIFFVPVWIGQQAGAYFPDFVIAGILVTLSLLPTPLAIRPTVADGVFFAVLVVVVSSFALGLISRSAIFDLLVVWSVAFVFGRLISQVIDPQWIYGAFGVFGAVAGAGAVVEFATGQNLFVRYLGNNTSLYGLWGVLQARGSVIRAEGAFGHSIALGITLGVSVCLVLGSRFRPPVKTALALMAAAGAIVSFSRSGMLTAVLAVILMCIFLRGTLSRRYRLAILLTVAIGAAVAVRPVLAVFASSDEADGSALYRGELLGLVRSMRPLGLTADFSVSTTSQASIGTFGSVDNALLLFGLLYGWIPLLVVLAAAALAVVTVLRRRATPATIAVAAQLPALFTVALITQYAAVAWFTVGLAVGTQALLHTQRSASPTPDPAPVVARSERTHA